MGHINVILPAMGEGIFEATITQWLVNEGDTVSEDDSLVEIATDKVDSEIPSPVSGIIEKILIPSGTVAKIGQEIAVIRMEAQSAAAHTHNEIIPIENKKPAEAPVMSATESAFSLETTPAKPAIPFNLNNGKFLSPLVRSIADKEHISLTELEQISGSGLEGRITKEDIMAYVNKKDQTSTAGQSIAGVAADNVEIIEMGRMRKLIADHMVSSKKTAPHVTSFHEVDVTHMVKWRETNKETFLSQFGEKLTFTPLFIDAVVRAIKKYPMINISVNGTQIIKKKNINIGMAAALPDGNLIVPVIKETNEMGLPQLAAKVNDLASRARNKQLQPHEIQGGTFTITNVGTFGNLSGTPIINQPEVAILAIGAIKKRPAVIETPEGDFIGIRHQMILALSYDHRVVDGSLGGMFLKEIADNIENFDGARWL